MTTHTHPPEGILTTMEDLDRLANDQQRADAKLNGGNGALRPMPDGWFFLLATTKKGIPYANVSNIYIELQHDPEWRDVFYFDELQHQLILKKPVPDRSGESCWAGLPREWQETDSTDALRYFNHGDYPTIGPAKVDLAILNIAHKQLKVHPIRDYLGGLVWDGRPRIDKWLETYCHAESASEAHQAYIRAVGLKWLVSAVARIYRPGCKADHALVLEGPQGIGKTSVFAILGGEWFSENLPGDLHSKDAAAHVRGRWVIELSELGQLRRSETETVKSFISRTHERYRPAYGKHEVVYPRQCVFGGTTNRDVYLPDETGNRRFWPVKVGRIDLKRDRDQLWAEAVHFYRTGECWWLEDDGIIATATDEQAGRREDDPWQEPIAKYLAGKDRVSRKGPGDRSPNPYRRPRYGAENAT
jgi:putative DNA primase/helicase